MASRWRIRHKLSLGLGLFVAVLAVILLGALYGLWSYYWTILGIRAKLAELKAAEEFKEQVAVLVAPHSLAQLRELPYSVVEQARPARDELKEYAGLLEESLDELRSEPEHERQAQIIAALQGQLDAFEKAVCEPAPVLLGPGREGEAAKDPVKAEVERLVQTTQDLRDNLREDLDRRINDHRRHYQISLWIVVPSSLVGLILMAELLRSFYAWVFYPIRDLEAGVRRVARGDFSSKIEVHSGDEMEDLAAAFNDMMRRLHDLYSDLARQVNERSRQLVRSERLASVGFLAAGVAHEINNPLASIAFCSEALEARLADLFRSLPPGRAGDGAVFAKYLKMIQEEAFRCKNITERLLAFSRSSERKREPADVGQLIQSVLDVTQHLQNCRGKAIAFAPPAGPLTAWINGEEIKSVVLNLVVNALDSMDEGGTLTIQTRERDGMVEARFADNGCGMSQEVLENIFEPFFTRSRTGKGTGLGLTISHRIVIQHGGEIEATSAGVNRGSTFTIRLPVQPPAEAQTDAPALAA